jgi:hypothetical protein
VQLPLSQIIIPGDSNSNSNSNSRRGGRREKTDAQFPLHRYLHTSRGSGNVSTGYNTSTGNNGDGDEISIFNGLTTVTVMPGDMLYIPPYWVHSVTVITHAATVLTGEDASRGNINSGGNTGSGSIPNDTSNDASATPSAVLGSISANVFSTSKEMGVRGSIFKHGLPFEGACYYIFQSIFSQCSV